MANKYHVLKVHQIKNQNMQKKITILNRHIGFCHKRHILLHNSFLGAITFGNPSINDGIAAI